MRTQPEWARIPSTRLSCRRCRSDVIAARSRSMERRPPGQRGNGGEEMRRRKLREGRNPVPVALHFRLLFFFLISSALAPNCSTSTAVSRTPPDGGGGGSTLSGGRVERPDAAGGSGNSI